MKLLRRWAQIAADLRPSADGSAVHTSPFACNWYYCAQFIAKPKAACALRFSWASTSSNRGLWAIMTSSIKPEVHNVSIRRQKKTEPWLLVTCTTNLVQIGRVVEEKWPRTDKHTAQLSMGPFYVTQSNLTHQLTDPIQPSPLQVEKTGLNPTQPSTTNNGAYSLVVTYFYTQNLSRTFSQSSINLFVFFKTRVLKNSVIMSLKKKLFEEMFSTFATVHPTQPTKTE